MNRRLNEYSLNVYQVVCLVIGLGCVWCSSDEDSYTNASDNGVNTTRLDNGSDNNMLNNDAPGWDMDVMFRQGIKDRANIIEKVRTMQDISKSRSKQIDELKKCQQDLMEKEQEASKNMNSTQSNRSFSDKSKDRLRQVKIKLISALVKEEIIRQSADVIAQQMEQWLEESKNTQMQPGPRIESICNLIDTAEELSQIESNLMGPQNQSPNSCRSILVNGLIAIGVRYNSHGLKSRIKVIIIEELKKILPKIDTLDRDDRTQVIDPVIDQLLKHNELESLGNISRIIKETLAQLDNRFKEMEVKSESEQEPTDPEPSNSRTQSSNPQTNKSGMDGKPHSSRKSADQDSTSTFDRHGLKQLELDQKDCTLKLDSEQEKLLRKFISGRSNYVFSPAPVWRMFDINEAKQHKKYGLSGIMPQYDHEVYLKLDWEESELMKLLDVLKKFSTIILNREEVEISYPRGPAGLLVLAQLLTLFENPELNAMKKPLEITISLPNITCPSLESSFNNVDLQCQFRNQIEKIEESRYIIRLEDINGLTSDIQKFIWPLATHLSISYMGIVHPQMNKIDFLNDVNWRDQFTLILDLDDQKDLTISLGARTAKGKDL
ncbi:hypothetical protein NEHOM01_2515, partial [Nematocida homosporus]|uniref:uncharacterized protein n=1 Tax=Nematocida homosporus TaxID=1912981 RepID=UPI002220B511